MDGLDFFEQAKALGVPLYGNVELTAFCNFDCAMCYVRLSQEQMLEKGGVLSGDRFIELMREAREQGLLFLCITGGEPTLHPEFAKIYEALHHMGFLICLQTNASTLNDSLLQLLLRCPPQVIKVTVYGASDATYEAMCGVKNGFSRVGRNLLLLRQHGFELELVSTITTINRHETEQIQAFAASLGLPIVLNYSLKNSVRGNGHRTAELTIADTSPCGELFEHFQKLYEKNLKPCQYCRNYQNTFWITWDGKLRFCSFMNYPDIDVRQQDFASAWQQLQQVKETLEWPQTCQTCEVRDKCPKCIGLLNTLTGCIDCVDQEYCNKIKNMIGEKQ